MAKIIDRNTVKAKIWERGSGVTLSSGSSSCAIVAAGVRLGLLDKMVDIESDGGKLNVNWNQDGIWIKGSTSVVFQGVVSKKFLEETALREKKTKDQVEKNFFNDVRDSSLLSRFLNVTEVANTILYISSPLASGTNGASIRVDGGSMGSIL